MIETWEVSDTAGHLPKKSSASKRVTKVWQIGCSPESVEPWYGGSSGLRRKREGRKRVARSGQPSRGCYFELKAVLLDARFETQQLFVRRDWWTT